MNKQNKVDAWTLFHSLFKKGDEVWLITDEDDFIFGKLLDFCDEACKLRFLGKVVHFRWDCIRFMSHDGFPVRSLHGADGSRSILKEKPVLLNLNSHSEQWIYGSDNKGCLYCKNIEHFWRKYEHQDKERYIKCKFSKICWQFEETNPQVGCVSYEPSGKMVRLKTWDSTFHEPKGVIKRKERAWENAEPISQVIPRGRGSRVFGDPFLIEGVDMVLLNPGNRGEWYEDEDYEEVIVCKAKDGARALLYDLETIYM